MNDLLRRRRAMMEKKSGKYAKKIVIDSNITSAAERNSVLTRLLDEQGIDVTWKFILLQNAVSLRDKQLYVMDCIGVSVRAANTVCHRNISTGSFVFYGGAYPSDCSAGDIYKIIDPKIEYADVCKTVTTQNIITTAPGTKSFVLNNAPDGNGLYFAYQQIDPQEAASESTSSVAGVFSFAVVKGTTYNGAIYSSGKSIRLPYSYSWDNSSYKSKIYAGAKIHYLKIL